MSVEHEMDWASIASVLGVLFGALAVWSIALDRASLPRVTIGLGSWTDAVHLKPPVRFWHVVVHNEELGPPWRWLRRRQFAYGADVAVSVWKLGAVKPEQPEVAARWNATREPIRSWWDATSSSMQQTFDVGQALANRTLSELVPRKGGYGVAFLSKCAGDPDCYLFNDEAYNFNKFQNPVWKLAPGLHYLQVVVTWADRGRHEAWLKLEITGDAVHDVTLDLLRRNPLNDRV